MVHETKSGETSARIAAVSPHDPTLKVLVPEREKDDVPEWVTRIYDARIKAEKPIVEHLETPVNAEAPERPEPSQRSVRPGLPTSAEIAEAFHDAAPAAAAVANNAEEELPNLW